MAGVCGDNRFEIIAEVKKRLIEETNIESHPEELAQVDNILFRLWQLNYFNQCNLVNCNGVEKIKADSSKQKALDYLIKSFPELKPRTIFSEVANYEIDGWDYRNPVVQRYVAYVDAVKELQKQMAKMKCCGNCRYCDSDNPCRFHRENRQCENYYHWRLKE